MLVRHRYVLDVRHVFKTCRLWQRLLSQKLYLFVCEMRRDIFRQLEVYVGHIMDLEHETMRQRRVFSGRESARKRASSSTAMRTKSLACLCA